MMLYIKKTVVNTLIFVTLVFCVSCQNKIESSAPIFPAGVQKQERWIREKMLWQQGQLTVEGAVFVSFTVDARGRIGNVKVEKSLCESCDKEAVRLVRQMPDWIPATRDGKPVSAEAMVPISFKLTSN